MIHIENVRLHHATNSSSSHSLIFTGDDRFPGDASMSHFEFGWENFTLTNRADKFRYLAVAIGAALTKMLPPNFAAMVMKELGFNAAALEGNIDHQSAWHMPVEHGTKTPNLEFVADLQKFIAREDVVVLGGNDNDDPHPLRKQYGGFRLPIEDTTCVARKEGDHWTLFNPGTGAKVRFSFVDPRTKIVPAPLTPELIDIKITDRCPYGCPACYQGSRPDGKRGLALDLWSLGRIIRDFRVFEVAVGGGEATLDPDFFKVLQAITKAGAVPSFSCRSLEWLRDPGKARRILEVCGAFAYSVHKAEEVEAYHALTSLNDIAVSRAHIQAILGPGKGMFGSTYSLELLLKKAKALGHPVTLLGFKATKAALKGVDAWDRQEWKGKAPGWWVDTVKEAGGRVGVDTMLAAELGGGEFPSCLYRTREGHSSMYLDLVEGRAGRSSYEPEDTLVEIPDNLHGDELPAWVQAQFQGWARVPQEAVT